MTIQEMHYDWKIKFDKVDSLKTRNFLPAEIDWMLNNAIQSFVDNRYKDFETIQDLIDQLDTLVIKCPTTIQPAVSVTNTNGVYEMRLSSLAFDYLHLVRLTALVAKEGCSSRVIKSESVSHDDLTEVLISPFAGPNYNWHILPYVFGNSTFTENPKKGSIFLYTNNDFTITEVYPEYLKIPVKVFFGGYTSLNGQYTPASSPVDCDLPTAYHRRIVDIAVAEASDYINKPDYQQKFQKVLIEQQ